MPKMADTLFTRDVPLSAILLPLALLVFLSYHFIIYPAILSPLGKLPNAHWSVPFSPAWILYQRFKKRENAALDEAHKRLGPFIRVGPNDVNVDDLNAVRTIYQGGFEKPGWYGVFDNYGYVLLILCYHHQPNYDQQATDLLQECLACFRLASLEITRCGNA